MSAYADQNHAPSLAVARLEYSKPAIFFQYFLFSSDLRISLRNHPNLHSHLIAGSETVPLCSRYSLSSVYFIPSTPFAPSPLRWTPLPSAIHFPLSGHIRDFHPLERAAGRTTQKNRRRNISGLKKKRETGLETAAPTLARWCSTTEPLAHFSVLLLSTHL